MYNHFLCHWNQLDRYHYTKTLCYPSMIKARMHAKTPSLECITNDRYLAYAVMFYLCCTDWLDRNFPHQSWDFVLVWHIKQTFVGLLSWWSLCDSWWHVPLIFVWLNSGCMAAWICLNHQSMNTSLAHGKQYVIYTNSAWEQWIMFGAWR